MLLTQALASCNQILRMAVEDFKLQVKPGQFCMVKVTPSSGKGCRVVKLQVERQSVAVGFYRAFFVEELKCVDKQHLAWLVMPLGTALWVTSSLNTEICMKFKKRLLSGLLLLLF